MLIKGRANKSTSVQAENQAGSNRTEKLKGWVMPLMDQADTTESWTRGAIP